MPFQRSARIEVVNQTGQTINAFYYHVDYQKLSRPLESTVAYFHANWRRDIRTKSKENYTILEARGEGQVVGVNMSMQSYDGELGYLEGDEMVYVDGEKEPSLYGTGTEDYFTSGWYFNHGEFAAPYHGLILKDDSLGRIAAYRFHVLDAIPFKQSVRFTIEHGHANQEIADYSSTAYWYQKEPHRKFAPMLPPGLRIPLRVTVPNGAVEAESLQPVNTTLTSRVEDVSALGPDWSDLKQLKVVAQKGGDAFTLSVPASEDRYDVSLYSTQGPEYGNADVLYDGKKVGEIKGYSSTTTPAGRVLFKDLKARGKELPIQFVVSGKDERSSGYAVGLDAFALEPHRTYIPEWYLIGPFPNPRDANQNRLGLDFAYPPEKEIDLQESYPGDGKKNVSWKLQTTPAGGFVDLSSFDPYELVVAYAVTYVYSPKDQTLPLMLGSDDGVKVLLNDKEAFRLLVLRGAQPDQNSIPLALKQGWNKLMLKIENNYGGFGFYARIPDLDNSLTFSTTKQK
jgi:hypothetical protein